MRGRLPSGPKYVEQLPGSDQAKERLQLILQTMAGTCRVQEACAKLGISEPRFHQLRLQVLEAALSSLEPRTPGRPPRTSSFTPQEVAQLQEQLAQKEIDLHAAQVRTEIALVLPQVVQGAEHQSERNLQNIEVEPGSVADDPEKKTPSRPRRSSQPSNPRPPGKRKNT